MKTYTLLYRPPSTFTLPRVGWTLLERPQVAGFERRDDLPLSTHRFGVVLFDRELTAEEVAAFELQEVTAPLARHAADTYTVAAYDAFGDELHRVDVDATHAAEACLIAERLDAGVRTADEYQAVLRHLSDEEIIAERYEARAEAFVCDTCGEAHTVAYATDGDFGAQHCCLACVYSGLAHGRHHVAEAFVEELLPACGYCGTSGHLASNCPEQPEEN